MGSGVCSSGEKIVYAWGRNAPELKLPNGKYSILNFSGPFKHLCKQYVYYAQGSSNQNGFFCPSIIFKPLLSGHSWDQKWPANLITQSRFDRPKS